MAQHGPLAQMKTPHHAHEANGHLSHCWEPTWQTDTCPSAGDPPASNYLCLCWGLPNFFGIFYFHLPGVAQHCTRNGLTWRKCSFGLCCTHVPSARRWKAETHHTQVGCKEGCVHSEIGRATRVRLYIQTPLFLNKFECLGARNLAEVINLINDLVTTVVPGVLAGPLKTCS